MIFRGLIHPKQQLKIQILTIQNLMTIENTKIKLINTIISIEKIDEINRIKNCIDTEHPNIIEKASTVAKYEYMVLKFIIKDLNGNRTVIDRAVSEILSTNKHQRINANGDYLKKNRINSKFFKNKHCI